MNTDAAHASERLPLARFAHDDQAKFGNATLPRPQRRRSRRASHSGWAALRHLVAVPLLLGFVMTATATGAAAAALRPATGTVQLTGAGSTFDAPFFDAAFRSYEKGTHSGQAVANANYYVPLPATVASLALSALDTIIGPNGQHLLSNA